MDGDLRWGECPSVVTVIRAVVLLPGSGCCLRAVPAVPGLGTRGRV